MNDAFLASMREAMHLLQTAGPLEATEAIQRALREQASMGAAVAPASPSAPMPAQVVERLLTDARVQARPADAAGSADNAASPASARGTHSLRPDGRQASRQDVGHFSQHTFVNRAGSRAYKLYVPAGRGAAPMPLVVMLHGCTQDADDFAAGTQMNTLADMLGFVVLYPVQATADNPSKCWNWFRPGDQQAGKGEPSIIAGMVREVIASHGIDARRVYVAGLSAGGAMAAVLIQRYPGLFAAAGVHSGLPAGSAHDLPSALGAMKGGKGLGRSRSGAVPPASTARPLIVFHGDADHTVHPLNGDRLVAPFRSDHARQLTERTNVAGGHDYTRQRITTPAGVNVEYWVIHGAGHAWAGGSPHGSYTDPKGPDASAEMLRFFLANPLPG